MLMAYRGLGHVHERSYRMVQGWPASGRSQLVMGLPGHMRSSGSCFGQHHKYRTREKEGQHVKKRKVVQYVTLRVRKGKEEDLQWFYITSLGRDHAILGYPWLHHFDPTINWKGGRVLGSPITIETALLKWACKKEINRIIIAACAHNKWEKGDTIITQVFPLPTHTA